MRREELWPGCPITYDNNKYSYEIVNDYVRVFDNKIGTTIFCILAPTLIKQINNNEFIVAYPDSLKINNNLFILKHLQINKETNTINVINKITYQSKNYLGSIKEKNEVFIMEGWLETKLYNPFTKKNLLLEDAKIRKAKQNFKNTHLKAKVNIEDEDCLTMYIDKDTLEFDGFYSRLEDRFIKVISTSKNNFTEDYKRTIKEEVIKYIELLKTYKENTQELSDKKAETIIQKHLIKKKIKK